MGKYMVPCNVSGILWKSWVQTSVLYFCPCVYSYAFYMHTWRHTSKVTGTRLWNEWNSGSVLTFTVAARKCTVRKRLRSQGQSAHWSWFLLSQFSKKKKKNLALSNFRKNNGFCESGSGYMPDTCIYELGYCYTQFHPRIELLLRKYVRFQLCKTAR